jgi:hypothetical protein
MAMYADDPSNEEPTGKDKHILVAEGSTYKMSHRLCIVVVVAGYPDQLQLVRQFSKSRQDLPMLLGEPSFSVLKDIAIEDKSSSFWQIFHKLKQLFDLAIV